MSTNLVDYNKIFSKFLLADNQSDAVLDSLFGGEVFESIFCYCQYIDSKGKKQNIYLTEYFKDMKVISNYDGSIFSLMIVDLVMPPSKLLKIYERLELEGRKIDGEIHRNNLRFYISISNLRKGSKGFSGHKFGNILEVGNDSIDTFFNDKPFNEIPFVVFNE